MSHKNNETKPTNNMISLGTQRRERLNKSCIEPYMGDINKPKEMTFPKRKRRRRKRITKLIIFKRKKN